MTLKVILGYFKPLLISNVAKIKLFSYNLSEHELESA